MGIPLRQILIAIPQMLICGAMCGAVYDMIRILRVLMNVSAYTHVGRHVGEIRFPVIGAVKKRMTPSRIGKLLILGIGDILFFVITACLFSIFLANTVSGVFRWFFLIAAGVGFVLYYFSVGKLVMLASEIIAAVVCTAARYMLWLIRLPFLIFLQVCKKCGRIIRKHIISPIHQRYLLKIRERYTSRIQQELTAAVQFSVERSELNHAASEE